MMKAIFSMLCMITLGVTTSIAQTSTLLASNLENNDESITNYLPVIEDSNYSNTTTTKWYAVPESATHFKLNTASGELHINVKSDIKYTKAELLDKDSNTTIQSVEINGGKESVDLSKVEPGTYYMILSNTQGDILSEKILVL